MVTKPLEELLKGKLLLIVIFLLTSSCVANLYAEATMKAESPILGPGNASLPTVIQYTNTPTVTSCKIKVDNYSIPGRIAYSMWNGVYSDIYLLELNNGQINNLTGNLQLRNLYPTISNDGTKIAFISNRKGSGLNYGLYLLPIGSPQEIITAEKEQEPIELVYSPEYDIYNPIWSPIGNWVAYSSHYPQKSYIDVINLDKKETYRVHSQYIRNKDAIWAKDKNELYMFPEIDDDLFYGTVIERINIEEIITYRQPQRFTLENKSRRTYSINLSGEILLTLINDNNDAIYKVIFGEEIKKIKMINRIGESEYGAVWSPDSKWIVYKSTIGNKINAFIFNVEDGKEYLFYSTNQKENIDTIWSKNSKYLAYTRMVNEKSTNIEIISIESLRAAGNGCELEKRIFGPLYGQVDELSSWDE